MYIEVAIAVPAEKTFTYAVPVGYVEEISVGKRVLVPFRHRKTTGYVVGLSRKTDREGVKDIFDVLDDKPLFSETDYRFYKWAADYYLYPIGKVLEEILPGGINVEADRWVCVVDDVEEAMLSGKERRILEYLGRYPGGVSVKKMVKDIAVRNALKCLESLQEKGVVCLEVKIQTPAVKRKKEKYISAVAGWTPAHRLSDKAGFVLSFLAGAGEKSLSELRQEVGIDAGLIARLEKRGAVVVTEKEAFRQLRQGPALGSGCAVMLNEAQQSAVKKIVRGIRSGTFSTYLLHGVTGSGKTEVYLRALEEALRLGGSALFLVPEIVLTPQLLSRINERFGSDRLAVLHSDIPRAVRYDQWRRIVEGESRIIVGARSAVFAPARKLKLIIIDEEHDASYKQDERLPYHARDLAIVKARDADAAVILGSATPGLQSFFNAVNKKYHYLVLPDRAGERQHPEVQIRDMRTEEDVKGKSRILASSLQTAVSETLDAGKQVLLFLNRRGFNTYLFCADCGYVFRCLNCSVSLTHHAADGVLKCHHCDFTIPAPPLCPSCRSGRVRSYGIGTERLEKEIAKLFPSARLGRMDSDTTAKRGVQEKLLQSLDRGDIDILIGTQMIAKGHDYPNVILVGVIMADASLNFPDFRAAESTFQLLTQVSGRGGRGDHRGRVIIQTYNPDHYAIRLAQRQDYMQFYKEEIALRRAMAYPPFSRMVTIHLSNLSKEKGEGRAKIIAVAAKSIAASFKGKEAVTVLGPALSPIPKMRGRYRWQLILKGASTNTLHRTAKEILSLGSREGLRIRVDVDPVNFM